VTPPSTPSPALSIVIPAYNEARRLPRFLERIVTVLNERGDSYEIIVVDDGSHDSTAQAVERLTQQHPQLRLIQLCGNRGKGAAVRRGMQAARGALQLFADADGATAIEELTRLQAALAAGADLAIGSRALAATDPHFTVQAQWHRSVLGTCFNAVVQRLGLQNIADTQCGFKLFRRSVAQDLFSVTCVDGYAFDLEVLYIARRRGYRIAEVPVNWSDQPGSKVCVWSDGFIMLRELLAIRKRETRGQYRPRAQPATALIEPAFNSESSHF
jgi:dolichyl-phosphate beta-glucosyltransferase